MPNRDAEFACHHHGVSSFALLGIEKADTYPAEVLRLWQLQCDQDGTAQISFQLVELGSKALRWLGELAGSSNG